jgi:predicted ATPase/class 3 adenylate cyclase
VPSLPQGTVTLLFTDIEGSTLLARRFGDGYHELLATHRSLLREAFTAHHGTEVDTQGDAFLVAFERAHDAVDAAVAAQHALSGGEVRVRIGIHTGEPRLADGGYYVGVDLSRGARICTAAHGGQVLLSSSTYDLVADDVGTRDLGRHLLKDIEVPERLFQLLAPGLREEFPPPRASSPGNLPRTRTGFFGRVRELDEICRLLSGEAPLVTLTGPGGIGKTRLAVEAARQVADTFADGAFFVSLAASSAADLPVALAAMLEVEEQAGRSLVDSLERRLRSSELLLVLDNFESALDAAPQLGALVDACPGLTVLATSRERLHLVAEHEYRLEPLGVRDAGDLFAARASAARPDLDLDRSREEVDAICAQLDRLPLALELAAARVRILPLAAILERLGERLSFLTGGPRDLPERQRTLAATIDWSYTLLDAEEQAALLVLSVFAGGASLEAIEHVVAAPGRGLELVTSLCDKSLVLSRTSDDGAPRFTMLSTIREYARARLLEQGRSNEARRQHAEYFLELAERAEPDIQGPQQATVLRQLAVEHDNFRAALAWADEGAEPETLARLVATLWRFWFVRGHQTEGRLWAARALAGEDVADQTRARALRAAAALDAVAGELDSAHRFATERLNLCRTLVDDTQIANALVALANIETAQNKPDRAAELYEQAATHARRAGARPELAGVMSNLGYFALLRDDPSSARATCREAAALFEELGFGEEAAGAWVNAAAADILLQDLDEARSALVRGLDRYVDLQHADGISYCLNLAAAIAEQSGDGRLAAVLASAADATRARTGATLPPMEQRLRDATAARIVVALDTESYAEARAEGASLELESAVAATRALSARRSDKVRPLS